MLRHELTELHYICPIKNISSIMDKGILSHRLVASLPHRSVALASVQNTRARKRVPQGRWLHDYMNLYLNARNPMMYRRQEEHGTLCVLRVDCSVLDFPGVVLTDGNAAAGVTAFHPSPEGLRHLNRSRLFATYWTHQDDPIEEERHKRSMCAEVLVPDRILPRYILGAYVSCDRAQRALAQAAPGL